MYYLGRFGTAETLKLKRFLTLQDAEHLHQILVHPSRATAQTADSPSIHRKRLINVSERMSLNRHQNPLEVVLNTLESLIEEPDFPNQVMAHQHSGQLYVRAPQQLQKAVALRNFTRWRVVESAAND